METNDDEMPPKKKAREAPITEEDVLRTASHMLHNDPFKERAPTNEEAHFRALFGCHPTVAKLTWNWLVSEDVMPEKATITHLLWGLAHLKVHPTNRAAKQLTGADPKTHRKWADQMIDAIMWLEPEIVSDCLI